MKGAWLNYERQFSKGTRFAIASLTHPDGLWTCSAPDTVTVQEKKQQYTGQVCYVYVTKSNRGGGKKDTPGHVCFWDADDKRLRSGKQNVSTTRVDFLPCRLQNIVSVTKNKAFVVDEPEIVIEELERSGFLDPGSCDAFEQRLQADSETAAEYLPGGPKFLSSTSDGQTNSTRTRSGSKSKNVNKKKVRVSWTLVTLPCSRRRAWRLVLVRRPYRRGRLRYISSRQHQMHSAGLCRIGDPASERIIGFKQKPVSGKNDARRKGS